MAPARMPAAAAAVFTQNRVQAAPVKLCRRHLAASRGAVGAILVNAGNANCATRTGDAAALACCRSAARLLRLPVAQVLPASTGVIGVEMDARLIVNALPRLVANLREDGFGGVARAIMTTDLVPKEAFGEVKLRMATTLGFVLIDAQIPAAMLRRMLRRAVERSYNRLSVDGDTSTNDTLLLLANGASGVRPDAKEMAAVEERITGVAEDLACSIARDGEGARKLITILVRAHPAMTPPRGWPAPSPIRPW